MAEKFCLKWNDFQTNVSNTFRKLRKSEHFYDVTLVSDDQQQVSAHKVVLSSSSEYFKTILTSNTHSHPMLCLSGVNKGDLENILNFIYNGEIQIYQDNLDQFLDIAQRFRLEGLMQGQGKEECTFNNDTELSEENDYLIAVQKTEIKEKKEKTSNERTVSINSQILNYENIEELDQNIEAMIEKQPDGNYSCRTCGKTSNKISNMKAHAEVHFDGLSFPCQFCDKSFRSRNSFRMHVNHRCHQRQ